MTTITQSIVTHITNIIIIITTKITQSLTPQPINTPHTLSLLLNQHTHLQQQITQLQEQITNLKFNNQFLEDTQLLTYNTQEDIDKLDQQPYPTI